jgi:hypothetical protein
MAFPIFGSGTIDGARARLQVIIQNSDGSWPSTWTSIGDGDITSAPSLSMNNIGSTMPIAGGTSTFGTKGFRMRVQFAPITNGQTAQANVYNGIFFGLPAITGAVAVVESTGTPTSEGTPAGSPTQLEPPNFDTGWPIP